MSNPKKKGGFTLAEAVIALAVIVIVTASALSIVTSATTAKVKALNKSEAINCAHNIWECFKASSTPEEFENNVYFVLKDKIVDKYISNTGNYFVSTDRFTAEGIADFESGRFNISIKTSASENAIFYIDNNGHIHVEQTTDPSEETYEDETTTSSNESTTEMISTFPPIEDTTEETVGITDEVTATETAISEETDSATEYVTKVVEGGVD